MRRRLTILTILTAVLSMAGEARAQDPALLRAVEANNLAEVQRLIAAGADVNYAKSGILAGWTALHFAAVYGLTEIIHALILAGADTDLRNRDGETPLEVATAGRNSGAARAIRTGIERRGGSAPAQAGGYCGLPVDERVTVVAYAPRVHEALDGPGWAICNVQVGPVCQWMFGALYRGNPELEGQITAGFLQGRGENPGSPYCTVSNATVSLTIYLATVGLEYGRNDAHRDAIEFYGAHLPVDSTFRLSRER